MSHEALALLGVGVSILGVGAGLAALILRLNTRTDARLTRLEDAMHDLSTRVARIEGSLPFVRPVRPSPSQGS